jgi:hypothetical protein
MLIQILNWEVKNYKSSQIEKYYFKWRKKLTNKTFLSIFEYIFNSIFLILEEILKLLKLRYINQYSYLIS